MDSLLIYSSGRLGQSQTCLDIVYKALWIPGDPPAFGIWYLIGQYFINGELTLPDARKYLPVSQIDGNIFKCFKASLDIR